MKKAHPTRKDFGDIFSLTFSIYFKNFWRNLGFGMPIAFVVFLFTVPYILITLSSINFTGYPFVSDATSMMVGQRASYFLLLLVSALLAPVFLTNYLAPKTIDALEHRRREKKEYMRLTFQVFGRTFTAQAAFFLITLGILVFSGILIAVQAKRIDMMSLLNRNIEGLKIYFLIIVLISVVSFIVDLFCIFSKQVALFEHKRWFGAVGKSVKTIASGNFWVTMGYYLLFGLIVRLCGIVIIVVLLMFVGLVAAISIGIGALAGAATMLGTPLGIICISIFVVLLMALYAIISGLYSVFTTLTYFNARTVSEHIPFPSPEENKEEKALAKGEEPEKI